MTTLHGTDITLVGLHPSFQGITRFSILRSTGITAVLEYLCDETVRGFDGPSDRIDVIPNFIDTQVYDPAKEPCYRSTLAREGKKILIHVSNFRPVKPVLDVIEIFARIAPKISSRLIMIGDGPGRPRAQELAKSLGVGERVVFLGKHDSVEELLSCADLFLLPSGSESFGFAALAAMASGTPVVAASIGGVPELLPHGEAGYLYPVGDVEGMSEGSLRILNDPELQTRFSKAARSIATERFSVERVVPAYEACYERALESHAKTHGPRR